MKSFKKRYPRASKVIHYTGKAINIASKAYGIASTIAGLINSEKKVHDTSSLVGQNINWNGTIYPLSEIAQGTTEYDRIGNSIMPKSIELKISCSLEVQHVGSANRLILFQDMDNNAGTAPTIAEVLDPALLGGPRAHLSQLLFVNRMRFRVLKDIVFSVDYTGKGPYFLKKVFRKFIMRKDKRGLPVKATHITFDGANAADTQKNHLYLLYIGSDDTAATYKTKLNVSSRLRYYDN